MRYIVNERIIEPVEISNAEIKECDDDSKVRRLITIGLFLILILIISTGLALSFTNNDNTTFKLLLDAITPFVAIAVGYYFGTQSRK